MEKTDFDVIIVGAGISGIDAAWHIQNDCKNKKYCILEARSSMGGTWDLFKYPGIRSDSDMYTLGFPFYPWKNPKAIADGPAILSYIKETASFFGIDKHIRYNQKVVDANWSDEKNCWTLTISNNEQTNQTTLSCNFLIMGSGYYNYENGYTPEFPGIENYKGQVIHPQKWTEDINYENKKVVIIGSGATAVTLLPEMAKKALHVVMLQRSPTYIATLPSKDVIACFLNKILPSKWAYFMARWKNILINVVFYWACKKWPGSVKKLLIKQAQKQLGESYDMSHFTPAYNPWDQRLCAVPDGDLFKSLRSGKSSIVTDNIQNFTENSIVLKSGKTIETDIIVTATGLQIQLLGGMKLRINGQEAKTGEAHCYRGVMFGDAPNFGICVGYTNSSWTLKSDLSCEFLAKVINYMDTHGYRSCTPKYDAKKFGSRPLLDFDAGYVKRALDIIPKQGNAHPWRVYQNYVKDMFSLRMEGVTDDYLEYK